MNKMNYEVYLIAAIETLINNNSQTDLGKYKLEYQTNLDIIGTDEYSAGFWSLALAVRLVDKEKNEIVWGNIYYKPLSSEPFKVSSPEDYENVMNNISNINTEQVLNFVLQQYGVLSKKPYMKYDLISPANTSFLENLAGQDYDGYPTVGLNGKLPKDAVPAIEAGFADTISNIQDKRIKR